MKRLTEEDMMNIRVLVDDMGYNLNYDTVVFEDVVHAHSVIKKLLFEIYMLKAERGGT